jgi:hypothetical protein
MKGREMLEFKDTKLLKHPTVERAYNVMRTFFTDGDDFAQEAIRAGELISQHAKTPDPDAIAASVLMNGMIVSLEPEQFETTVSPGAAKYLKKFYDLDLDNPKFTSAGEEQVLLAQSMAGLEGAQREIDGGKINHVIEFRNMQQILDANERALKAIARKSAEPEMLAAAEAQLAAAQQSLADVAAKKQKESEFENTGLPDHPVIRAVYKEMRDWDLDGSPVGGYARTNAAIARVIVDTGASADPEVISAALLNQYSNTRPGHKKPEDFSARIGDLYRQTSPWADLGGKKGDTTPKDPEAQTIANAALTYFLEEQTLHYRDYAASAQFDKHTGAVRLESLENLRNRAEKGAALETHSGLKTRMEKAVQDADALMNAPGQTAVRKPGSPRIDPGW